MKKIKLTKGYEAFVDDSDYDELSKHKWHVSENSRNAYAIRTIHFPGGKKKTVRMHRQIMGASPDLEIDHIDHNGLNNQRRNLRECNNIQNQMNRVKVFGKSIFKGVTIKPNKKNYASASIRVNKKLLHLGYFDNEESAARAYDKAAYMYFGEYANLNFK